MIAKSDRVKRFIAQRSAVVSMAFLAGCVVVSLAAPYIFEQDAFAMQGEPFIWPGTDMAYPLGTDMFGRDILTGLVYGARISLAIGLFSALISTCIGVAIGLAAGYFRGWVDNILMRFTELFQTIPPLLFVVTIVAILQPSIGSILMAIGLTSWTQTARLVRAEALRIRQSEYIAASFTLGLGSMRILFFHVLPNAISPAVVTGTILAGTAILTESALAFLGLGDPNIMSWGSMIGAGRQVLRTAWYITAIPGLAIVATVLSISALGNALNKALDIRAVRGA